MSLFEKHEALLMRAMKANHERSYYAAFPESPKAYPGDSIQKGKQAYEAYLHHKFSLRQMPSENTTAEEVSPYTQQSLGVAYPLFTTSALIDTALKAFASWRKISVKERTGVLLESLEKMMAHFFDIAFATQHTTGQSWMMSFQASGPHAADRALEAIAMGYEAQTIFPGEVIWEKPAGKSSVTLQKTFSAQPRGISLVIGCSTFPVWNSLPGIYASLVTGNPVIMKPHPKAILPIAICVAAIQQTLSEHGYDANTIQLAADQSTAPITKELAAHPDIKMIDYTGSSAFGEWIESLPGKVTFTEKAGVNSVIIDSVKDLDAAMQNLSFSLSLYSGQMCTAPQNFFIPQQVETNVGTLSFEQVAGRLKTALEGLVNNPKMGAGVLGAVQNETTLSRIAGIAQHAHAMSEAHAVKNEEFPESRTISPVLIEATSGDVKTFETELFGPIAIAIKTRDTEESIRLAKELAAKHGAITCAAYTTSDQVMKHIAEEMNEAFVPVTFNLTGPIWVNQHAAFSDFHVTGGNAAGNASLTDFSFASKRIVWVGNRRMIQ